MIKILVGRRWFCILASTMISGCAAVVEPVVLTDLSPDVSLQEEFNIETIPLTFEEAKKLNSTVYERFVSLPGTESANVVKASNLSSRQFPPQNKKFTYYLGVGDEVELIQAMDSTPTIDSVVPDISEIDKTSTKKSSLSLLNSKNPGIISTVGRIGSDGSLLLIGVGRLDAEGRPISQLRDEVRNILIRNGKVPNFQLEIKNFNSQKAYVTTDSPPDIRPDQVQYILPITDQGTTLRQIIASAGIAFDERHLTLVKVQRGGKNYVFTLHDLFNAKSADIYLEDKDHIFIQNLEYKPGKVFMISGTQATVISIKPEERQTLAEVIFAKSGPMNNPSAQRSGIYLLRGQSPIQAFYLDAQNPARVLVADSVELRPNDIVFSSEQPISTFNRVLSTILPMRLLSRDVDNGTIP
jgi:polysaccharide export outer membrane protein